MFADIRTYEEFRATSLSDRVKLIEIGRTMVSPEVAAQAGVLAAKHASGAKVRPVFLPQSPQIATAAAAAEATPARRAGFIKKKTMSS
jgi:hypothetical protein